MVKKKSRIVVYIIILVLIVVALYPLISEANKMSPLPVLSIIIGNADPDATFLRYYTIYNNEKIRESDAFTPDETVSLYSAVYGDFKAEVVNGQVKNTLKDTLIEDRDGNSINADERISVLMQVLADTLKHDISKCTIIETNDHLFAFVKLNVNWSDPCELYMYKAETKSLEMIHKWNNVDIMGASIPHL